MQLLFFMNKCSDDFRFTDNAGKFSGKEQLKSNTTYQSDNQLSDSKACQSGNLAMISGLRTAKITDANGRVKNQKVAFTYTLLKQNGKWMFVNSQQTDVKE